MNILIVGAGAIGSLFASLLAREARITLLSTNAAHVTAIRKDGLLVEEMNGQIRQSAVDILSLPQHYPDKADCILICTKAGSTAAAASTTAHLLSTRGIMLSLQNGLGNYEHIVTQVGQERAMAGTTSQAATLLSPGKIRHSGAGLTQLAVDAHLNNRATELANLFNRAGIATQLVANRETLLWEKLIINVGINALAALLRVPNGVLGQTSACREIMRQAVTETLRVARALRINLDSDEHQFSRVLEVCRLTAENHASMLQDVLRGRATEVDAINGAVAQKARDLGLQAPVNHLLTELIKALSATTDHRL